MHGLQAISVFLDVVMVRLLLSICFIACCSAGVLGVTLAARLFSNTTAPLWTPVAAGGLFVLILCLTLGGLSLALGSLAGRKSLDFIPIRDYRFFIEAVQPISAAGDSVPPASKVLLLKEDSFQFTAGSITLAAQSAAQL